MRLSSARFVCGVHGLCFLHCSRLSHELTLHLLAGLTSFFADQPAILPEVSCSSGCASYLQVMLDEQ